MRRLRWNGDIFRLRDVEIRIIDVDMETETANRNRAIPPISKEVAMLILSATCAAIAFAANADQLKLVERQGRFGGYVSIEDATGVIEVADTMEAALLRVSSVTGAL